jgi:hypothetical protein
VVKHNECVVTILEDGTMLSGASSLVTKVRVAVSRLPDKPELADVKRDIGLQLRQLESKLDQLSSNLVDRDRSAARTARRQLILGLIIGIPLGILGSYIAYLLGIN